MEESGFPQSTMSFEPESHSQSEFGSKQKGGSRHRWTNAEDVKLLRRYRGTISDHTGKADELWLKIHEKIVEFDSLKNISQRAVRERCIKVISEFRTKNRLDEWKTGDPGTFPERESLLCDILEFDQDVEKRGATQKPTTKEMQKQGRKDAKFEFAAAHRMKKRKLPVQANSPYAPGEPRDELDDRINGRVEDEFDPDRNPKRERTSFNCMIKGFLDNANTQQKEDLALKKDALELQKKKEERTAAEQAARLDLERERLEIERKKEENRAEELKLQSLNAQLLTKLMDKMTKQ